jgi:hypothetical protein
MKILNVRLQKSIPPVIVIEGEYGKYGLLEEDIENMLIEDDQMCPDCLDSGLIEERKDDNIITKKCLCKDTN